MKEIKDIVEGNYDDGNGTLGEFSNIQNYQIIDSSWMKVFSPSSLLVIMKVH